MWKRRWPRRAPWDGLPGAAEAGAGAAPRRRSLRGRFRRIFALLAREAGKTLPTRWRTARGGGFPALLRRQAGGLGDAQPRGVFTCISPWNFPLAIFTGQIAAALAAGNACSPSRPRQTPLIAAWAVELMHEAGVPRDGAAIAARRRPTVGAALTSDPRIDGVAFTGSTATAQAIHRAMAASARPARR
jgi:RHH-type proline utilization regulon transcriptional repressor/proline dehydrogenase/delta 1-pyrroline-5-carboxylate dehydrogenase